MLKCAARLEAGENTEEIRQLMNNFQQSQPEELLKICHSVLSECLELEYDYFNADCLLQSHMGHPIPSNPFRPKRRFFQSRFLHHIAAPYPLATKVRHGRRQSLNTMGVNAEANGLQTSTFLVPRTVTDLLVQITQLQYHLKDRRPVYALDPREDWAHLLCHSRQLLG